MTTLEKLHLGIVGACGRGASFKCACDALANVCMHAVCDTNAAQLPATAALLGAHKQYVAFDDMLASANLDAVIVATPMHLHVSQSVAALTRGLHVLCEVPAAVSLDECRRLTDAWHAGGRVFMMAENYTYMRANVLVRALVGAGLFGTPYYAEGEYLHELKALNEQTPWRRVWQTGIDGITYGTHSLGPILQWFRGDRVVSVACAGAGHHSRDIRGTHYEQQETCVMLCRMRSGGLVKIRLDMLSDRPHAMTNYQVQGTDGAYESARAPGEPDRIWLRRRSPSMAWQNLYDYADEFMPAYWRDDAANAAAAGHGGGDYFELLDFVNAIHGTAPCPIDLHAAMDMTLPGLCSQESIRQDGRWIAVPDSRAWIAAAAGPQSRTAA